MTAEERKNIPTPHGILPADVKKQWLKAYEEGFDRAKVDYPDDPTAWSGVGLREANRLLRVNTPKTLKEAEALPAWQVLNKVEKNGVVTFFTIDARKFSFDAPVTEEKKETPKAS